MKEERLSYTSSIESFFYQFLNFPLNVACLSYTSSIESFVSSSKSSSTKTLFKLY